MNNPLLYCALCALFFGGWPIVTKMGGVPSIWIPILITIGTAPIALAGYAVNPAATLAFSPLAFGLIAGIMNGLGMLAYGKLICWQGNDFSKLIPISMAMGPAVAAIGGWLAFGEPFTLSKVCGLLAVAFGVYLLG